MTYRIFGLSMSSKRICDRYGLRETDIARCFADAEADRDKAAFLIENLIAAKPIEARSKEVGRRTAFRSGKRGFWGTVNQGSGIRSLPEGETDYWEEQKE